MIHRRAFVTGLGAALAAPLASEAQQAGKVSCVAHILTTSPLSEMAGAEPANPKPRDFLKALRALGWVEGQNLIFERRSAEGRPERYGDIIRELISLHCDVLVIVTTGTAMTREALEITSTVPIVAGGIDPLMSGFVRSLARPGRNLTAITGAGAPFEGKRLSVLKEALPNTRRVAVLEQRSSWDGDYGQAKRAAAVTLGLTLLYVESEPTNYARAFNTILRERPDAIFLGVGPYLFADRHAIIHFATRNGFPLVGTGRYWTEAGALLSYSVSATEYWKSTAGYVDRILRGANPADLPIQQQTTFELVINLKTAKALGLVIPPSLLRADQVIE